MATTECSAVKAHIAELALEDIPEAMGALAFRLAQAAAQHPKPAVNCSTRFFSIGDRIACIGQDLRSGRDAQQAVCDLQEATQDLQALLTQCGVEL